MKKQLKSSLLVLALFLLSLTISVIGITPVDASNGGASTTSVAPEPGGDGYSHAYDFGSFYITINGGGELVLVKHYVYADYNYVLKKNSVSAVVYYLNSSNLVIYDEQVSGNFAWVKARVTYPIWNPLTNSYYYYGEHSGRTPNATLLY